MANDPLTHISNQLSDAGFDHAVAIATESEINAGAACGQLSLLVEHASN